MKRHSFQLIVPVLTICLLAVFLGGCNNASMENDDMVTHENNTCYKTYPLDSQEVTIWIDDRVTEGDEYTIIKITDPVEIASLTNNVDFQKWWQPESGAKLTGLNYYYIQFNDQTTIAMYDTVAYGDVGSGKPDKLGNLQNLKAEYFMPDEFLQAVQQLVKKHT